MADVAGLIIGVAALWQSCVQVYEIVDSTRQHGMEFELLNVKFEVERVRLLCWGDAVGLATVQIQDDAPTPRPDRPASPTTRLDIRLRREEVRGTVLRLLGCIQHVFANTDRLQEHYGLQEAAPIDMTVGQRQGQPPSQSQRMLNGVFRRAYDNLRRMAGERQRTTPLTRRTVWAVRDRRKFDMLVGELRGFNDSLESMFPDAQLRAAEAMRAEIEGAVEIRELQLLQLATADEHRELSESASLRLEALGATVSARTELLSSARTVDDTSSQGTADNRTVGDGREEDRATIPAGTQQAETAGQTGSGPPHPAPEIDELTKRLKEVELYVDKKSFGALSLTLSGPMSGLARVSGHVYWDGQKQDRSYPSYWDDRGKGFVSQTHASFDLYKRKKYFRALSQESYERLTSEDYALLDPESHLKFENENPGTVTVEGYGLECWDFETTKATNRKKTIMVNSSDLPVLKARTLLRRLDDLQNHEGKFGWSPDKEELDLKEIVGGLGITYFNTKHERDPERRISDLYSVLNRTDIFADFTDTSSVGLQWSESMGEDCIGIWNFLRQIIIGRELAVRLKNMDGNRGYAGFTERILGSLIVCDLWLKHVRLILVDAKLPAEGVKGAETEEDRAKAEDFKNQGNEALKKSEYQKAVDLYTEAIKLDLSNAVYRCNRSAALMAMDRFEDAEEDAYVATLFDSSYAKAWSRLGMSMFKQGEAKRAKEAYERAIHVAGKDATPQMRQGLASAKEKVEEQFKAIKDEKDLAKQHSLHSAWLDEDWEISGKTVEFHSVIHEQQVEGLLLFAERMRWPYINEVRDYAEDVYSSIRAGGTVSIDLHDWLYGMILPGKWFAFKIMTALIQCTMSIRDKTGIAPYFDCGLVLPTRSYWRIRTVLGRVLGCLSGISSLCGWIGPGPKIEFDPPSEGPVRPRHVRVKARRIALTEHHRDYDDAAIFQSSYHDRRDATRIRPDEEVEPYLAEMRDSSNWVIPEPPVRDVGTCEIVSIKLKKLALQVDVAQKAAQGKIQETEAERQTEYRASITFKIDNNEEATTYKLFTNPVFVVPPSCLEGPKGQHEVHMRELPRYQNSIWSVEKLKDHTAEDVDRDQVMVINATGKGAEVLARAWCSERGRCAVIRRPGGPCFVCAVRAASKAGLGTGVLIWTG